MKIPRDGQDHYRLLGVSPDASTVEIRRAYRRLARRHHPDRNPHPDSPARFRALADAYAVLTDPVRRARYDDTIRPAPPRHARPAPPRHAPPRQPPVLPRRGTLELSAREAQLAATSPLKLTAAQGIVIVLPAGVRDGDHIIVTAGHSTTVLTVRVNQALT